MVHIPTRGLHEVVDGFIVHVRRADAADVFIGRDQAGAVEGIQDDDLGVFDFDHIAGFDRNELIFRNAPLAPDFHALEGSDERNFGFDVLENAGSHIDVDVVSVVVRREDRITLGDRIRIVNDLRAAQVGL